MSEFLEFVGALMATAATAGLVFVLFVIALEVTSAVRSWSRRDRAAEEARERAAWEDVPRAFTGDGQELREETPRCSGASYYNREGSHEHDVRSGGGA